MGELRPARDVAGGEDALVGGAQPLVHKQSVFVVLDTGGLQAQAVEHGPPPRGDQEVAAGQAGASRLALERDGDAVALALDLGDLRGLVHTHAFGLEAGAQQVRRLGIAGGQQATHLHDGNVASQVGEGLAQLGPDGTAADDDEVLGPLGQVEDGLVGQIRRRVEPRDGRDRGRGARGQDEALRLHPGARHVQFARAGERRLTAQHAHAQFREALLGILGGDAGDDVVNVVMHRVEGHARRAVVDAVSTGAVVESRRLARGEQRLGGHAAGVQAVAAHLPAFDQDAARAHLLRPGRNREAGGAGPDDPQIRFDRGRIAPHRVPPFVDSRFGIAACVTSPALPKPGRAISCTPRAAAPAPPAREWAPGYRAGK